MVHISDGDTITVEAPGHIFKVRLFGIDCPEKDQPDGWQATGFTTLAAFGRTVEVVPYNIDRYGRMVTEIVLPNGRVLNKELLKAGHAWWYEKYAPGYLAIAGVGCERTGGAQGPMVRVEQFLGSVGVAQSRACLAHSRRR